MRMLAPLLALKKPMKYRPGHVGETILRWRSTLRSWTGDVLSDRKGRSTS